MITVSLSVWAMLLAAPASFAAPDRNAMIACQLAQGAGTDSQDLPALRALVEQASRAAAESTEPEVRRSATMLGRSARRPDPVGMHTALRAFRDTCKRTVTLSTTKSHEVSEEEFDRQLRDVLKRTGKPNASCEKQQFGEGWAAVCE